MQTELEAERPGHYALVGVDGIGFEATASLMTDGRVLPWLQDNNTQNAWTRWGVVYRDVVVVGDNGVKQTVYNLTEHDLNVAENRAALKALLLGY